MDLVATPVEAVAVMVPQVRQGANIFFDKKTPKVSTLGAKSFSLSFSWHIAPHLGAKAFVGCSLYLHFFFAARHHHLVFGVVAFYVAISNSRMVASYQLARTG